MLLGACKKEHIKPLLHGPWLFFICLIFAGKKDLFFFLFFFVKAAINENHRFNSGHEKTADFSSWN